MALLAYAYLSAESETVISVATQPQNSDQPTGIKMNEKQQTKMRTLFSGHGKAEKDMGLAPIPPLVIPRANDIWANW